MKKINLIKLIKFIILLTMFTQVILIMHRNNFSTKLLFNFYKIDAGLNESVYKRYNSVHDILYMIKVNKINNFNYDPSIYMNLDKIYHETFRQRIFELSYPARVIKDSKFIFSANKNLSGNNCTIISEKGRIFLYECS